MYVQIRFNTLLRLTLKCVMSPTHEPRHKRNVDLDGDFNTYISTSPSKQYSL